MILVSSIAAASSYKCHRDCPFIYCLIIRDVGYRVRDYKDQIGGTLSSYAT